MQRAVAVVLMFASIAACSKKSPTSPSQPSSTPTRIIGISGDLHFGNVEVGESRTKVIRVGNSGSEALSITSISGPHASIFTATPITATIPAGASQDIAFFCKPASAAEYSGTVTLVSNATSGSGSTPISCFGVRTGPLWRQDGSGNTVFDMPSYVARVRIKGAWNRTGNSNFIVRIGNRLVVNEILRDSITYEGTHLTNGGGATEIVSSSNIAWSFEEVR